MAGKRSQPPKEAEGGWSKRARQKPKLLGKKLLEKLWLLVSFPVENPKEKQDFAAYEAGKKRRYELLFAVNGGAYALATWLATRPGADGIRIGDLEPYHIGLGMAGFAAVMCLDLFAFGLRFQQFFGLPGKFVIIGLTSLLMAGWLLAGDALLYVAPRLSLPATGPYALLVPVFIAFLMALLACLCARPCQKAPKNQRSTSATTPTVPFL